MNRSKALAVLALVLGVLVVVYSLNDDGMELSFPLLLGVLLIGDGIIRWLLADLPSKSHG